ncbi:conserved uncharacterized protein, UPF0261 [Desulfosarcina variabilis str. Montpellier]|uniref:Tm-1-like ATP-binding domain-containing protein n=1 Tax=Desulfosarcina variabilis TaxID=2300 RepID=UPI003AFA5A15
MDSRQKAILVTGTCDTKGDEILYMKEYIESKGLRCLVLDLGLKEDPKNFQPDFTRQQLAESIGSSLDELIEDAKAGRYEAAVEKLAKGAESIIHNLQRDGMIDGILAIGGSMGTAIGLRSLRCLPVGFPKVLVSTVAVSDYLHPHFIKSDVILVQPISDFFGLNQWSKRDLKRAASTICNIVLEEEALEEGKWLGLTAIGWVASVVPPIKRLMEEKGFKVAITHSVSMQTGILEDLIRQGVVKGMIDLCPFELLHEITGGACHSRNRLKAAAEMGVPTIVAPGSIGVFTMNTLQMPEYKKQGRFTIEHNEILGTAKPTIEEMIKTAELMCERLNASTGKVAVLVPSQGFFNYDRKGKMYYNPEGRSAFINVLKEKLDPKINLEILDCHWEDLEFMVRLGELCVEYFADIE